MGTRLKDLAAAPVSMIAAAMERLPDGVKGAPRKAMEAVKNAGPDLPGKLDKVRDALPGGKTKKSPMGRARRIVEGAGTALSVAVTGWEIYELLRSRGDLKSGTTGSRRSSSSSSGGRKSTAKRSTRGGARSSSSRSSSSGTKRRSPSKGGTSRRSTSSKSARSGGSSAAA